MREQLREKITSIVDWRHPYDLGDGVFNQLGQSWYKGWHEFRLALDFDRIGAALNGVEGKRALDLGCNDGFYGFALAKRGASQVVGMDALEDHIYRANLIKDYFSIENASFLLRDIQEMDLAQDFPEGFDLVLFYRLLYHLSNPIETLRALGEATHKMIAVQTFVDTSQAPVLNLEQAYSTMPGTQFYPLVCRPSQSAVVKMLHYAGFPIVLRVSAYPSFTSPPEFGLNTGVNWGSFYGIKADEKEKSRIYEALAGC